MPADLSRFRAVRGWIATPVARQKLTLSLIDDLNRCLMSSEFQDPVMHRRSRPRFSRACFSLSLYEETSI